MVSAMTEFEKKLAELKDRVAELDPRLVIQMPAPSDLEPPLFVNTGRPPVTDEEIEFLLAQDAG